MTSAVISACATLGPDYEEPRVGWVEDWETSLYGQVQRPAGDAEGTDLSFWWQSFEDPILNQLIQTARLENPGLRIAGLRILESQATLGIVQSSRYPQLQQASGSLARADSWDTEGNDSGERSDVTAYDLGFNIGWELDFWGRFARGIESADAAFFASVSNQQNVQVLLSAQVAQAYFAYRTTALQIVIAQQNAALQRRSFEITTKLYDSGQAAELDLQQANTQYLSTLATIPSLEIAQRQLSNTLALLLGRPPGAMPELEDVPATLPTLSATMIDDIPGRLLMRRPDVRTSAWQVAAQSAQIGVAEADLYPSISLFGTIGWSGNSLDANNDSVTTGIGPSFTWNLFNYGRIKNNVRAQDARLQQAIENYQNTVLQAATEIDNAAISVVKTLEQDAILRQSLAAAERSLKLSSSRYQEGYSDFQRVLDAQRSLAVQSNNRVSTQGAHIDAVIAFYKALGGGWQQATIEQVVPESLREIMQQRTDWGDLLTAPLPTPEP